jgi:hypothetical protein
MSVEEKLDRIIELLEKKDGGREGLKEKVIDYMMKNYNISFIDDTLEENVYETLIDLIFSLM